MEKKIITSQDVEYLSKLARIELKEEEKKKFEKELLKILEYIEKLNEVNTENVLPTYHVLPVKNVFRDDIVEEFPFKEKIIENAPDREKDLFKVPRII
jgi:aspartyl-tRNA(Asn)/glutamyl-tRNA(Gln) amidotransferase subunit C